MTREVIIELKGVSRHYVQGARKLTILNDAHFALRRGEMVALVAPSGTGKSTLLHISEFRSSPLLICISGLWQVRTPLSPHSMLPALSGPRLAFVNWCAKLPVCGPCSSSQIRSSRCSAGTRS